MGRIGIDRTNNRRPLRAESLEARQLLHGGGLGGAAVLATVFEKLDADENGQLVAEELTETAWSKLSTADTNDDGGISQDELLAEFKAALEPSGNRPEFGGHSKIEHRHHRHGLGENKREHPTLEERVDSLFELAGDDNLLGEGEVSAKVWARIATADTDGDGLVSKEELRAYIEAKQTSDDDATGADSDGDDAAAPEAATLVQTPNVGQRWGVARTFRHYR